MSEPNATPTSWAAEGRSDWSTLGKVVASTQSEQLTLHLDLPSVGAVPPVCASEAEIKSRALNPAELQRTSTERPSHSPDASTQEALVTELLQLRSLTQDQLERIHNLEQALDQSLISVRELQQQVVDQEFLEAQLASTEDISNVQQRAITRLKQQLAQQEQTLQAQLLEAQERDRTWQELLVTMEALTQAQQAELEHLRGKLMRDRGDVHAQQSRLERRVGDLQAALSAQQERVVNLESQSISTRIFSVSLQAWLDESLTQIQDLAQQVQSHQPAFEQLESSLNKIRTALQAQRMEAPDTVVSPIVLSTSSTLAQELAIAQGKIEELETQIAKQLTTEAMLQHVGQELEAERDRQQGRLSDLERQTADMQEQILQQAQQASEYETAVQHWKDRYVSSFSQMQRLKELVSQLPDLPVELSELLEALPAEAIEPATPAIAASSARQGPPVDLPEFLLRRRNKLRQS